MTDKEPFYIKQLHNIPFYLSKYKSKRIDNSKIKLEIKMPVYNSLVSHPRLPSKMISKLVCDE